MNADTAGGASWIRRLLDPSAYGHAAGGIRLVETHISWVLLTGEYAYKIKKPLKLPFLDFSSLELRLKACRDELELNRRFAPELYLEVVPVTGDRAAPRLAGPGTPFEYAVKMRQFDPDLQLDRLLAAGSLSAADLQAFGFDLAGLHRALPQAAQGTPWGEPSQVQAQVHDCLRDLLQGAADPAMRDELRVLEMRLQRCYRSLAPLMLLRKQEGRVRECHGDLHLGNLVKSGRGIVPFDCIEFSADLRWIDVMSDAAFLTMDLVQRGHAELAYAFLNAYLEASGDYQGLRLLHYYAAYRALVRAKIAMIRWLAARRQRRADADECSAYLRQALDWSGERRPGIILMHGLSGSGKTGVSGQIATELPAIRVRSDVERKRLHGLARQASSGSAPGAGIYTAAVSRQVYSRLAALVRDINGGGETAIVDAAFLDADERDRFSALARELDAPLAILDCTAPLPELERRVTARAQRGDDASEADLRILRHQLEHQSPLSDAERRRTVSVDTTAATAVAAVCEQLRGLPPE